MVLAPLLAAPAVMFVATAAERRFGAAVAGVVGAAPVALAIVILSVGADLGPRRARRSRTAAAHVVAQVAFAVAFALVVARRGGGAGLLAGDGGVRRRVAHRRARPSSRSPSWRAIPAAARRARLLDAPPRRRRRALRAAVTTAVGAGASVALVGRRR